MSEEVWPNWEEDDFITVEVPATHQYVPVVEACVVEIISPYVDETSAETVVYNLRLAIHEACANIVDHAYHHQPQNRIKANILLSSLPSCLIVELLDTGEPLDIMELVEPDFNQPQGHGYGLFLMRTLLDDVRYTRTQNGNRWLLMKNLQADRPGG